MSLWEARGVSGGTEVAWVRNNEPREIKLKGLPGDERLLIAKQKKESTIREGQLLALTSKGVFQGEYKITNGRVFILRQFLPGTETPGYFIEIRRKGENSSKEVFTIPDKPNPKVRLTMGISEMSYSGKSLQEP